MFDRAIVNFTVNMPSPTNHKHVPLNIDPLIILIVAALAAWPMQPKIRRESRGGGPASLGLDDGVLWGRSRQLDGEEGRGGGAPADARRLLGDVVATVVVTIAGLA